MDRISKLKEYLQSTPGDPFLQHALALEYVKLGDDASARNLFENVLTQHPAYVGSYYHLAKLLERNGSKTEALSWYEKGMQAARDAKDRHALSELQMAYEELTDE